MPAVAGEALNAEGTYWATPTSSQATERSADDNAVENAHSGYEMHAEVDAVERRSFRRMVVVAAEEAPVWQHLW